MPFETRFKEQLFSYMRLLRLTVGILICDKIYLYFLDFDDNETSIEIAFTKDNANGAKFIELFEKKNYDEEAIKKFIEKHNELKSHIQEIRKDLQGLAIADIIKNHYASKYSTEEIEQALKNLQISVTFTNQNQPSRITHQSQSIATKSTPNHIFIGSSGFADYYDEPQDIDYMIIKTSQERVDLCNGSMYEATRSAWRVKVENVRQYKYVLGVIKGIVRGVYCVEEWHDAPNRPYRYEFTGYDAPSEIAGRFLGKRIPPQYSKPGLANPVLFKTK